MGGANVGADERDVPHFQQAVTVSKLFEPHRGQAIRPEPMVPILSRAVLAHFTFPPDDSSAHVSTTDADTHGPERVRGRSPQDACADADIELGIGVEYIGDTCV